MGKIWSPPTCDEHSACNVSPNDPCSFSCVKKYDCPEKVVEHCIYGVCYRDCTTEVPQYSIGASYWSCDNTGKGNLFSRGLFASKNEGVVL